MLVLSQIIIFISLYNDGNAKKKIYFLNYIFHIKFIQSVEEEISID